MVFYSLRYKLLFSEELMLTKGTGFARYSKPLCLVVAVIWLILSVLSFTSGAENATINGLLWLAGAIAFIVSAFTLGRSAGGDANSAGNASD